MRQPPKLPAAPRSAAIGLPIQIYAGLLAGLGVLFGLFSYLNPALMSPGAAPGDPATQFAFYTVGGLSLGLSVGLVLALVSHRPQTLALMLVVRLVVAVQDLAIAIHLSLGPALIAFQAVICGLGLVCLAYLLTRRPTPARPAV